MPEMEQTWWHPEDPGRDYELRRAAAEAAYGPDSDFDPAEGEAPSQDMMGYFHPGQ